MEVNLFIGKYRAAFSEKAELPIAFWYSDSAFGSPAKAPGCMFGAFDEIRDGVPTDFTAETIRCGGGKFYSGFAPVGKNIPHFVSQIEKYKKTPEMVAEGEKEMDVQRTDKKFLHFARIDKIESLDDAEGLIFFATPDVLSGLCSWAFYDTNSRDAVRTFFSSGCSSTITALVNENRRNGKSAFIGLFDPSVRPYVGKNILSFSIPMSRFREMYETIGECFLSGSPAWTKVRARISE